jgi:hypothetical protein
MLHAHLYCQDLGQQGRGSRVETSYRCIAQGQPEVHSKTLSQKPKYGTGGMAQVVASTRLQVQIPVPEKN